MRWLAYLAAGAAAFLTLALLLVLVLVDTGKITEAAASQLSDRIGEPVALGAVDLTWLPAPAVRIADVRIGDGAEPLLSADAVSLDISLLALFAGKIVLRAVDVERPRLVLELGSDGRPVLPALRPRSSATPGDDAPTLLITSLRVRNGVAQLGPWQVEQIEVSGGGNLDLSADFDVSAAIPGIGALRDGRVELSNLIEGPVRWSARGDLVDVDVANVREQLAPGRAIWGQASAVLDAAGEGSALRDAGIELALRPLDLRSDALTINGNVDVAARLGGPWKLDLENAEVVLTPELTKPVTAVARAEGTLPSDFPVRELRDFTLRLGESELRGDLLLPADGSPSLELSGDLELGSLASWSSSPRFPKSGRLRIDRLSYSAVQPLFVEGRAESIVLPVTDAHSIRVTGPVYAEGTTVGSRELGIEVFGETLRLAGSYDLASERVDVTVDASGLELSRFSEELGGEARVSGQLYARAQIEGPARFADLTGRGEFEVPGGEMINASLPDFLSTQATQETGVDRFSRMSGRFELKDKQLIFSELIFEQAEGSALLEGFLSLVDGTVDLKGEARAFAAGEVISSPVVVTGFLNRLVARVDTRSPEEKAEAVRTERRMLQGMKEVIRQREPPDDPELAAEFQTQLERIDRMLQQLPEPDPNEPASDPLADPALADPGTDAELDPDAAPEAELGDDSELAPDAGVDTAPVGAGGDR